MYTYTYTYNQSFHQYSYGFQNLMSSFKIWCQVGGRGQKFQNYSRYVTFLLVGVKVKDFTKDFNNKDYIKDFTMDFTNDFVGRLF